MNFNMKDYKEELFKNREPEKNKEENEKLEWKRKKFGKR